jgi:hypothetical protein
MKHTTKVSKAQLVNLEECFGTLLEDLTGAWEDFVACVLEKDC